MVHAVIIPNCPVNPNEIKNANTIFGPDVTSLKGKIVRRQTKPVVSNYIKIPKETLQLHKTVLGAEELIFVNGMDLLVRISRHVKFTTAQYLGKSTTGNMSKYLENINDVYYRRGMYVENFYMDRKF